LNFSFKDSQKQQYFPVLRIFGHKLSQKKKALSIRHSRTKDMTQKVLHKDWDSGEKFENSNFGGKWNF
jgi:hypothetical protein